MIENYYSKYFKKITDEEFNAGVKEIHDMYLNTIFVQRNPGYKRIREEWLRNLGYTSETIRDSIISQNIVNELSKFLQNLSLQKPSFESIELKHLVWKEDGQKFIIQKSLQYSNGTVKKLPWTLPKAWWIKNEVQISYGVKKKGTYFRTKVAKINFLYSSDDDIFWCGLHKDIGTDFFGHFKCDDTLGLIKLIEWFSEKL